MSTNSIVVDALTTSLVTLTGIRLLGVVVFLDLWIKKREEKYLLLITGWLLAMLGSSWGLYTYLFQDAMEHVLFSLLAALGTFWIGCGILAYFQEIDIIPKFVNRNFLLLISGLIVVYGLLPFVGVGLGPSPGIFVQLLMSILVIFAALFKRRAFFNLARSSYTWLIVLAVFWNGLTLAFVLGTFGSDGLALGFAGTSLAHLVAIIFFLHLEFNLTNRQLKDSEQRFMRLAENAQDLIYRYDFVPQPGFTYVSPAATEITGYTPEEHYTDPDLGFKLVHPDDRQLLEGLAKGDGDIKRSLILRWVKKDGSIIWCEQRNVPVYNKEGNLIAIEGIARDITTERLTAQQYQLLFREMLEGFALHEIVLDDDNIPVDYRFLEVNPAYEKMTGLKAANVIGRTVLEVLPDTEPFWIKTFGHVAMTGEPVHFVNYSRALDKYFEVTAFQPAPKQFATVITDVTERLETDVLLKKSEETYRLLVENQEDMIVKVNAEGDFLYVSPSYCRVFGKTEEELLGKNFMSQIHKEDIPTMMQAMESLEPPLQTLYLEQRAMTKDGWRWQAWSATAVLDDHGEIAEVIGHGVDITERKQAEEALNHSYELMRYILEHNQSGIAVHDSDLNYIYVSQKYLDQYGIQESDVIGKHHYDVFPDLPQKWRDVHQKALKGEVVSEDNDIYEREDGSKDWTRWECRPWYKADGSIGGIVVYTEVITKQKQVEEELLKLKEDLEIQVAEKTQELRVRIDALERYHKATVEREFRMKELRDEIKRLKSKG